MLYNLVKLIGAEDFNTCSGYQNRPDGVQNGKYVVSIPKDTILFILDIYDKDGYKNLEYLTVSEYGLIWFLSQKLELV